MAIMNCEQAQELQAMYVLDSLNKAEIERLLGHVDHCIECQVTARGYSDTVALLAASVDPVEPPPHLRARILRQVYDEVVIDQPRFNRSSRLRKLWSVVPSGRRLALAVAVASVLLVGFWGWRVALHTGGATPSRPEAVKVQLSGTTEQPNAHGLLNYDPATQTGVITVANLLPLNPAGQPANSVYEIWLIQANHTPVASGFLTLQPDGHTWIAAVGANLGRYTSIATTEEKAGGSNLPTGAPILSGQIPAVS